MWQYLRKIISNEVVVKKGAIFNSSFFVQIILRYENHVCIKKASVFCRHSLCVFWLWPHVVNPVEGLHLFSVDPDLPMEVSTTGAAGVADEGRWFDWVGQCLPR